MIIVTAFRIPASLMNCLLLLAFQISAAAVQFDLSVLGKLNQIEISLAKGPVFGIGELKGAFTQVNGRIFFKSENPSSTKGSVLLDSRTLRFGYHKVDGDAQKASWLDSSKFPKIFFQIEGLRDGSWKNGTFEAEVFGPLTIKDKTSQINFPVKIKYLTAKRKQFDGRKGDLLVLQGSLPLSRGTFGINPGGMLDVIKDQIAVTVKLIGCSTHQRPLLPSRLFYQ